jgi:hypothetical protein
MRRRSWLTSDAYFGRGIEAERRDIPLHGAPRCGSAGRRALAHGQSLRARRLDLPCQHGFNPQLSIYGMAHRLAPELAGPPGAHDVKLA